MANPTSKVVVVTRTKDRGLLLRRAVESVSNQTFRDFIHVIVNDGGDSKEVERIAGKFNHNPKIIHNTNSTGHTKALNQGIRSVTSKYIAILDDDDTWDKDYLKTTIEHLEKTGVKGVVTVIDRVVEEVTKDAIKTLSTERWRPDIDEVSLYGQCVDNYAPTVAFVYSRRVYDELNGYDESLGVSEDWEFTVRFLLKYDIDFINTKDALAFYHHRPKMTGAVGNSVFDRAYQHRAQMNKLANHLLRLDLREGKLGVGYIMNSLRYDRLTRVPLEAEQNDNKLAQLESRIHSQLKAELAEVDKKLSEVEKNDLGIILGRKLRKLLRRN